jgi:prevent-host-death family protein
MPDVSSADVQRNFGAYRELAEGEAVRVMHYNKPSVVIVSAAEYDRLKRRDKQVMLTEDLPEWIVERVAAGDVGPDEMPAGSPEGEVAAS